MSAVATESVIAAPPAEVPPRLELRGVGLWIGPRVALDDVSLAVQPRELFGILGPSGCGKSSLMRCMSGAWEPSGGTLWLDGEPLNPAGRSRRARLGVVFDPPSLEPRLSVEANLSLAARLFAVPRAEARQRVSDLLAFVDLAERRHDPVATLTPAMARRLELARALINRPSLLLIDYPTAGLDADGRERFWRRLQALRRSEDLTIVIATRRPEEAERCDRVALLDRGRVVVCERPATLLRQLAGDVVDIEAEQPQALAQPLRDQLGLTVAEVGTSRLLLLAERGHELLPRIVESCGPGRCRAIALRRPTLTDVFWKLCGRPFDEPGEGEG